MKYLYAFVAGVFTGAVVALIFAPESGQDLRMHLGERAVAEQQRAQAEYHRKMEEMQGRMGKMQADMQTMIHRSNQESAEAVTTTTEAVPEGYVISE